MIGVGVGPMQAALQASGPGPPVLLATLYPTGSPLVRAWLHPMGTCTFDDASAAALSDDDPATYMWLKSVNTGGYGTQTIRRVNWEFSACPADAQISYLVARLLVRMLLSGATTKTYVGVEVDDGQPGDPKSILPVNNADFAWQEYLFAQNFGVPWTPAGVDARTFGTDFDQYLSAGNPANSIEYRVAKIELQVWGTT